MVQLVADAKHDEQLPWQTPHEPSSESGSMYSLALGHGAWQYCAPSEPESAAPAGHVRHELGPSPSHVGVFFRIVGGAGIASQLPLSVTAGAAEPGCGDGHVPKAHSSM